MTTILIVDDHWLYASALGQEVQGVLPDTSWLHAGSLADALAQLSQENTIEYVFLDLKLPDARSLEALHAIRRAAPDAKVAIVSAYEDVRMMREAYDAGAIGYLPKAGDPSEFKRALAQLLTGGFYFPAQMFEPASVTAAGRGLTPRETDVLNELVLGQTTKKIARKLGLAPTKVDKHVEQIRAKFGARTRVELLARVHDARGHGDPP
jgi:DNA-binding NarL/FixJ family response regulator